MTRFEFTKGLRKALSGRVNYTVVNENVAYYENYIDTEIKKGRSEQEVMEELGDPRLIARTIIDTAGDESAEGGDMKGKGTGRFFSGRVLRLPGWVVFLLGLLFVLLILQVAGLILSFLAPAILPMAAVWLLIRYLREHR